MTHKTATLPSGEIQPFAPVHPGCFVYVIAAQTPGALKTYVGWTLDPDRRLEQHNAGTGAKSTRGQQWVLLYVEKLDTRAGAMSREWRLKRDRRFRKKLTELLSSK